MAYIYPNSHIYILSGVNLNNDYDHTIYFDTELNQVAYFRSKIKYSLSNQNYVRKERGWLQINIPQWNLLDCTYLMFNNPRQTNQTVNEKWFYAFINSVEYVNENVSLINFEIDVIQTWMFDYTLEPCFVEREHTTSDELFENTIEEKLDVGKTYYNAQIVTRQLFNCDQLLLVCTATPSNISAKCDMQGNIFTGLNYSSYDLSSASQQDDAIQYLEQYISSGLEDNVILLIQYPHFLGKVLAPTRDSSTHEIINPGTTYTYEDYQFIPNFVNVDGYVPKNKKLFCFPYNYLNISDKEGTGVDYKWELWNNNYVGKFRYEGCVFGKPTVQLIPKQYRGLPFDYENAIVYDNFPICAWSGDSYQIWLAQNRHQMDASAINAISNGVVMAALGAATLAMPVPAAMAGTMAIGGAGSILHGMVNMGSRINELIGRNEDAHNLPSKVHGSLASAVLNMQNNTSGFEIKQMTIRSEYARIIDEYFSKFGYACHQIKVPNRNARTNWTYTKTVGCELIGNIPSDDTSKIKSIYDKGITFWNNGNNIGNYGNFDNPIPS